LHPHFCVYTDTAAAQIAALSLHDALPIWHRPASVGGSDCLGNEEQDLPAGGGHANDAPDRCCVGDPFPGRLRLVLAGWWFRQGRSEEHTSELQSRENLVCRLLLEKKKNRG